MEKQPWTPKYQQSVVTGLERRDELLNNGNSDNLLDTNEINGNLSESKCDKNHVKDELEAAIGEKAKIKIQSILDQVNTLIPIEKLLLYLKLPTENTNHIDPLRQPLNPLGSRTEISQTIMWIKTHLEEDPEISLQKKGVYEEYVQFCEPNNIKPLSTADFGKVMKQVYPKVRPRRLGTRGNSQYCYSGLRKRIKLSPPILPDLSDKPLSTEPSCSQTDLFTAAWTIVKEWSESKLRSQFQNLHSLAFYLVKNLSVGLGTTSALLVTSTVQSQLRGDMSSCVSNSRHKETMRKIQQKCESRDQKRKLQTPQLKIEPKSRSKKPKIQLQTSTNSSTSPIAISEIKTSPSQGLQPVCDKSLDFTNLQALPDFSSFQRSASDRASEKNCDVTVKDTDGYGSFNTGEANPATKVPIPRLTAKQSPVLSPKRTKNFKYKHIQPKPEQCDIASYNPQPVLSAVDSRSQETVTSKSRKVKKKELSSSITPLDEDQSAVHFTRERLISIGSVSKDALDDYLGTNNSQENEEELMKYFENENVNNHQEHDIAKKQKLSQLRLLLEQSCVAFPQEAQDPTKISNPVVGSNSSAFTKTTCKDSISVPNTSERPNVNVPKQLQPSIGSARRRVSFDTHAHEDNVPPSPNTRRKNFSFTPISPGPHSPTGRQSKCSSTNASPFVSPRNTPVPRARGNSHPYPGNSLNVTLTRKVSAGKKVKHELDLSIDVSQQSNVKELLKNHVNMPMSAPPSPKTNLLQNILNSNQKYSYTPNYNTTAIRNVNLVDQLSPEVTHLLSSNTQQAVLEPALRSQSVPLNVVSNSCFTHFPFNIINNEQDGGQQNDFNDMDSFSEGENINVNKIIDTIDQANLGTLLDDGNLQIGHNEFCNVEATIDINNDMNMPIETDNFCATNNIQCSTNVQSPSEEVLPNLRTIDRSQTIDIDDMTYMKCNPSRSVPSTPVPYSKTQPESLKIDVNHYSRSYPSTPLANETFKYNQTQDYLLNGQPIKEKILDDTSSDLNLLNIVNKDDMYVNMFHVASTLISDNKNNFNFDGQIAESSFNDKQNIDPVLNQECIIENDYFKSVPDMNRT